jgi:rubredoxin
MSDRYRCAVCGYPDLHASPWEGDAPSDEICPSCGTHFGHDDVAGGDSSRRSRIWLERGEAWKSRGLTWFSIDTPQPPDWNPEAQVAATEDS